MGKINREDMLELTRRMTLKETALTESREHTWTKRALLTGHSINIS